MNFSKDRAKADSTRSTHLQCQWPDGLVGRPRLVPSRKTVPSAYGLRVTTHRAGNNTPLWLQANARAAGALYKLCEPRAVNIAVNSRHRRSWYDAVLERKQGHPPSPTRRECMEQGTGNGSHATFCTASRCSAEGISYCTAGCASGLPHTCACYRIAAANQPLSSCRARPEAERELPEVVSRLLQQPDVHCIQ